jgi:pyrimidine operon attenuation protein/uracil phosphoribosyltransferase
VAPHKTIGPREVHAAIERLAAAIKASHPNTDGLLVLGIANGGIPLARRLCAALKIRRVGDLDISFHRDDIGKHPIPKEFTPTLLPGDVNGATVLLVDDVLFSGRTVKAALDELFDHGRPAGSSSRSSSTGEAASCRSSRTSRGPPSPPPSPRT